ncbi:hypothetical protein A2U01_0064729, partial [Trifolium medium]|nr:hypothetical protein [Trifolium medium]
MLYRLVCFHVATNRPFLVSSRLFSLSESSRFFSPGSQKSPVLSRHLSLVLAKR